LTNLKEWIYRTYIQVGNMEEIRDLSYWDFRGIVNVTNYDNTPTEHKYRVLSRQQKQMIANKQKR